jgi:hypothetical protein
MVAGDTAAKSIADPTAGCAPLEAVTQGIAGDSAVLVSLNMVPRTERSISEVINLWNAGWSSAASGDTAPLAPVRERVSLLLTEFPAECLDQIVTGPRLVPVSTIRGTTFISIGSGSWRWSQLVRPEQQSSMIVLPVLLNNPSVHPVLPGR